MRHSEQATSYETYSSAPSLSSSLYTTKIAHRACSKDFTSLEQTSSCENFENSAANHLRRVGYVPVCHANIVDMTFESDVWLVGRHIVSTADMITMATSRGFQSKNIQ
ncbi:MAG: hypothetical protein ABF461_00150 [Zymomonas mobilis subsp. pomaceae]|uniref:Uncharacterized protein n=1 Tax=Zymomonas mobilis subsp. pomaceae (strain ATCC 29192 / DSM 22645 / JCM 10191 / CCUG 17912 / NBRC 13757 / NCIMB 11200 / NRRL B-4491 / Barker I) TaxID=579138 RepID=F8EUU9_ZYMMT|nr:hypothetical protein [Zymomonas mobilis]AEI37237.1 hypothetical protein Zymop_0334 [Zymomonas mobilis subsp. pomaceae ATCC 29192]MDX5948607.1 hypothetical protein [Zymomonas mobilis subsp. pomaceae]GEB88413.1 hypothetical protein ZMO02_00500 [Zymomonas mobilis subsp. pomaceae]